MTIKKAINKIHLWLGLTSGLLVLFLGITGCILAFQQEIENVTKTYFFSEEQAKPMLIPSKIKEIADRQVPGKKAHSILYEKGKSVQVVYYSEVPAYYYCVYLNPYTGSVLKVKNMDRDFFRIVVMGHYYLWLPPAIGQPIVASGTLIFLCLLISGIILWWPSKKTTRKQRFTIKWNAKWRRVNYDLHNVFGFYISVIVLFTAITGLVMGFKWFANSVYWVASGGEKMVDFYESHSDTTQITANSAPAIDRLWFNIQKDWKQSGGSIDLHVPDAANSSIEVAFNPLPGTYWKSDYRYFDQYTLKEIKVKHSYGKLSDASAADKIMRMNYDIHVGAILGLPGKMLAFFGSLIASSLPVTGFIIWLGRRNKKKVKKLTSLQLLQRRKEKYQSFN